MAQKILITDVVHQGGIDFLRDKGYDVRFSTGTDEQTLIRELSGCEGAMVRGTIISRRILENAKTLKVITKHGVGPENIDIEAATECGIMVCNTPLANATSVAEHTMMLILCCAKRLNAAQKAARQCDYKFRNRCFTDEISGQTLGIIGYGNIGSRVARMAHYGFGMNVIIYDPYISPERIPEDFTLIGDREVFFSTADYVSPHIPTVPATHKTIGAREFFWMKPSAFFINAARGIIADEAALIDALREEQIAGAALDVTTAEPIEADNPLLQMEDKVILTPHNAASTEAAMRQMCMDAAKNLDDFLSGRRPQWVCNM